MIGVLSDGSFFSEGSLAGQPLRMGSAAAITDCAVMRIDKKAVVDVLHREHELSDLFRIVFARAQCPLRRVYREPSSSIPVKSDWPECFSFSRSRFRQRRCS